MTASSVICRFSSAASSPRAKETGALYQAATDAIIDFTAAGPAPGHDPGRERLDFVDRLAWQPRP